jgi:acyl dehydratase
MAFMGFNMEFKAPLRIGDTIHSRQTVVEKRETKKDDRGIVRFRRELVSQDGQVIQTGDAMLMVHRKKK